MANGQVTTGFSKPYVATYANSGTTITYSGVTLLARGVNVNVEPDTGEDNNFYADNQVAESVAGAFTKGTLTLSVDGLLMAAERLIMGLPAAAENWTDYGDDQNIPYVGVGFVRRVMSEGVTSYIPYVLPKVRFAQVNVAADTQEEEIDWQTEELSASIFRSDNANRTWKRIGTAQTTEAAAEALVKAALGYVATSP